MILSGILIFIPIFIIFIVVAIVKNKNKEESETMFRSLYVHLVMFATLMMVIGGGISAFFAIADIANPTSYFQQTFTDYKSSMINYDEKGNPIKSEFTDKELKEQYDEMIKAEKESTKDLAISKLIKSFGFIIIPLPIFLFFNKQRKKISEDK